MMRLTTGQTMDGLFYVRRETGIQKREDYFWKFNEKGCPVFRSRPTYFWARSSARRIIKQIGEKVNVYSDY